jgi:hypothetical protein
MCACTPNQSNHVILTPQKRPDAKAPKYDYRITRKFLFFKTNPPEGLCMRLSSNLTAFH